MTNDIARRTFLTTAAAATAASAFGTASRAQQAVPNSTGTNPAKTAAPANATDCHMHIYDPRFAEPNPRPGQNPKNATVSDYRLLQKRTGTTRVVVVTPRNYATDNSVTLDALKQLGASARGVAVVRPIITDAELKTLADGGIRGTRFSLGGANAVVTWDMVEPLSRRVNELGWHVQFNVDGADIITYADLLRRLPSQMVFDHLGHPELPAGTEHSSHAILRGLLDKGRTWIKLSGAYSNSNVGPPDYPEATKVAQAFVKAAPERLVWGSAGRIRASRTGPFRTTPCCSTCSRCGHRTDRRASAFSSTIRRISTASQDRRNHRPGPSPLTLGNVDTPLSTGNGGRETSVAGWA